MPATCLLMSKPDCRQSSFGAHRSGAVTVEAPQHIPFLRPTFLKYVLPSFFINKLSNFASLSLILNSLLWLRSRTQVNPQGFPAAGDKVLGRGQSGRGEEKTVVEERHPVGIQRLGPEKQQKGPSAYTVQSERLYTNLPTSIEHGKAHAAPQQPPHQLSQLSTPT